MSGSPERLQQELAGRYEIEREVGQGGMATVYAARDLRHRRRVAIKVLRPDLAIGIAVERFRDEIDIAASLTHPNILPVFDSGGSGDCLYYVMPLVEGESLRQRLEREKRLNLDVALRIMQDVADALAYAHGRQIVHRDIKPENILFVEGHAVVTDFGIARAIERAGSRRLTFAGIAVGTPLYMSPEQASGDPSVDLRSDIYSLACVLYEMLGGSPPHPGDTPQAVLASKLTETPRPLHSTGADVPPAIDEVITKALASDAAERYSTATEFAEALSAAAAVSYTRPRPSRARRVRMRTNGMVAVFGLITALSVAGAIAAWRRVPARVVGDDGRIGVAVLPFRPTVPAAARWSEAIPDLLATTLDGTPGVRVADPWSLWRTLRETPQAIARSPDPEEAQSIAQRANACCFVLGSVAELPGQVDVSVRIYRRGDEEPLHTFAMRAPPDSLASLVQRIGVEVIARLSTAGSTPLTMGQMDRALTRSPDALKAWLVAREQKRRGQLDSAESAIGRAIALDSAFVLALIEATGIRTWQQFVRGQPYADMRTLGERAARLSDSLPERPRMRAAAILASLDTRGAAAAAALERVLARDSLDFDAWSMLSYVHMAYGWQYGRRERDAIGAAERAVRLDSTDVLALIRRLYLAMSMNDEADVEMQVRRLRRADTNVAIVRGMLRGVNALQASDSRFAEIAGTLTTASLPEWIAAFRVMRAYRPDRTERLIDTTRRRGAGPLLGVATGSLAQTMATEGRWTALDSLRRAGVFAQNPAFERTLDRVFVAGVIAGAGDEALGRASAATLARSMNPDSALAQEARRPVWLEGWLIGAHNAMFGDSVLARRWANALGSLPEGGSPRRYGAALRYDIEARLAARRGDRQNALAAANAALELWNIHTENQQELLPEPAMRFHLAMLLRASNQPDSAASLFRSLVPPTTWMGFYTVRAALELGEIEEARGERADAQRHMLTALRMWERGDTSVAPLRDRARRAMARLGEGRRGAF